MDYRELVNPTYYTAKTTAVMLAEAGNADAKKMVADLNLQDTLRHSKEDTFPFPEEELRALLAGSILAIEARYAAVSRFLSRGNYRSFLDIGCGYTPRSLYCARAGIDYVGLEVPIVAEELQQYALANGAGVKYIGGDATNNASLLNAVKTLSGELLISCEGLLHYLSADEAEQLIIGIQKILSSHSGAWITSDFGLSIDDFSISNMHDPEAAALYLENRGKITEEAQIYHNGIAFWDEDRKMAFLESHGLLVERLPLYYGDEELAALDSISDDKREVMLSLLKASTLWKITFDPSFASSIQGTKQMNNLIVDYRVSGERLFFMVRGRIDTLSAPILLELFDKNCNGISSVTIDATQLEYISSAGLRTLLIIVKRLGGGTVKLVGTTEAVKEILASTGFDQIFIVK